MGMMTILGRSMGRRRGTGTTRILITMILLGLVVILGSGTSRAADTLASLTSSPVPDTESVYGLPAILGDGDLVLYRRIIAAQTAADWGTADRLMTALRDRQLIGYLLAERYLDPRYRARFGELHGWLNLYADLGPANAVHALALKRKSRSDPAPRKPRIATGFTRSGDEDNSWRDRPYRSTAPQPPAARKALTDAEKLLHKGDFAGVLRILASEPMQTVDAVLVDQLRTEMAKRLFLRGEDRDALALARAAARSADYLPEAPWIAGLAAWRIGRKGEAATYFEAVAESPAASHWNAAAGAFWAARAHHQGGRFVQYERWMSRAADYPATFYGLIAQRVLGREFVFDWSLPNLGAREIGRLQQYPGVRRALALLQLERHDQAEQELRRALPQVPEDLMPSLLTLAERGGMPGLAMSLGGILLKRQGVRYDAALYPIPRWRPEGGFQVDPALLFAIARQESQFDPNARSGKGATGLMQLMPETARSIAGHQRQPLDKRDLLDPEINLTLAEKLVHGLLTNDAVKGNLFRLAVAYNGGAGNMQKWQRDANFRGDPLMYIETIPAAETRAFVERVVASYWIYQIRLRQPASGLDAIAANRWPVYRAPGSEPLELALRNGWN